VELGTACGDPVCLSVISASVPRYAIGQELGEITLFRVSPEDRRRHHDAVLTVPFRWITRLATSMTRTITRSGN